MKCTPCLFRARMWSERSFGSETRFTAKKLDPKSGHFDNMSRKEYRELKTAIYLISMNICGDTLKTSWGPQGLLMWIKNFTHFQLALLNSHADKCPVPFHLHNSYTIYEFQHSTENICIESFIH
jgi:hypothetical protein